MDCSGIGKGPEVTGTVAKDTASHENARVVLLNGHLNIRIRLVITEANVVARPILFNERIFQDKRFHFVGYDNGLQVGSMIHHGRHFDGAVRIFTYITLDTVTQVYSLADVNNPSLFILPEIDARLGC